MLPIIQYLLHNATQTEKKADVMERPLQAQSRAVGAEEGMGDGGMDLQAVHGTSSPLVASLACARH